MFIDFSVIDDRLERLKRLFPGDTLHAIPIKTNPLGNVLKYVSSSGLGLEAASLGEVMLAKACGLENARIVFDSPAKTRLEIEQLQTEFRGIRVNADSLAELERYPHQDAGLSIGLRINPLVDPGSTNSMNVGNSDSKFGTALTMRREIIQACLNWRDLDCLHLHIGSQVPQVQPMLDAVEKVVELAQEVNAKAGRQKISHIDLGGGFPVNYGPGKPFMIEDYIGSLRERCPSLFDGNFQLITEFGRYVYANAGWVLADIEYVKPAAGQHILITHAGADLFLRECYNPGVWPHRMSIMDRAGQVKRHPERPTSVAGPLCFGGDFLCRNELLPEAGPGDRLLVHDIGANTFALWSRHCSRPFPKVLGYWSDRPELDCHVVKQRESYEDIVSFWF